MRKNRVLEERRLVALIFARTTLFVLPNVVIITL